jgi:hypothetical protein
MMDDNAAKLRVKMAQFMASKLKDCRLGSGYGHDLFVMADALLANRELKIQLAAPRFTVTPEKHNYNTFSFSVMDNFNRDGKPTPVAEFFVVHLGNPDEAHEEANRYAAKKNAENIQ